jgi:hypothetical protein
MYYPKKRKGENGFHVYLPNKLPLKKNPRPAKAKTLITPTTA